MNTPSERLQAIKEQNAEAVRLKHKTPPGPPPPPMDWREPNKNPRMVKLRRFEPGRVRGSREKSEIEQGTVSTWQSGYKKQAKGQVFNSFTLIIDRFYRALFRTGTFSRA